MCKALAVIVLHLQGFGFAGRTAYLCTTAIDCHDFQAIGTGRQTYHVCTSVGSVVAHQLVIHLCIVAIGAAFHINMIAFGSIQLSELHIGRLQPAFSLCHLDNTLDDLVETDALHLALERVAA